MIVIGDVHGKFKQFKQLIHRLDPNNAKTIIQIGDLGIGFPDNIKHSPNFPTGVQWFRGNHDNPEISKKHPQYMGDYGTIEIEDKKVFYLAGAWSIDQCMRVEGVSWWRDEELSIAELNAAFDVYTKYQPDIVLSHDAPTVAAKTILKYNNLGSTEPVPTRTGQALTAMFGHYQPKRWIFGHYHYTLDFMVGNTTFTCLNELDYIEV